MNDPKQVLDELLDHIDLRFDWYMDRPRMYSFDALSLEILFDTIERLRERVLQRVPANEPVALDGFNQYLKETHPHLASQSIVAHACKTLNARPDDDRVYQVLIDFWRDYLVSPYRTRRNKCK